MSNFLSAVHEKHTFLLAFIDSCSFHIHQNVQEIITMEIVSQFYYIYFQINFYPGPNNLFLEWQNVFYANFQIGILSNRHKPLCVTFVTVTQMSRLNKLLKHAQMASCNGSNFRLIRGSIISWMNCLFDSPLFRKVEFVKFNEA